MPFFDSMRLNWPENGDINAWADFIETICMFSEGDSLSIDDFIDFLRDDASKTNKQLLTALNFNENFLLTPIPAPIPPVVVAFPITGDEDEMENEATLEEDEFEGQDLESMERERIRSRLLVLFSFLEARCNYFNPYYPYKIDNGIHIKLLTDLTLIQQLYVVFLLSSEMKLFSGAGINQIGHRFEALCKYPFERLLPTDAAKKFFGAGAGQILKSDYNGNLHDRLVALADDLGVGVTRLVNDPDEVGRTGDAGLDWVGWMSFDDGCDHQPVYFGQCACGANWKDKQHETSLSVWRNFLELNQSIQCFHFMPRSFRRMSLQWFKSSLIIQELTLIDRFRLLKLFDGIGDESMASSLALYTDLLKEADKFEYQRQD